MRGSIKICRWLPFRARQMLAPRLGTVWEATVGGVIRGSDRYVDGIGGIDTDVHRVDIESRIDDQGRLVSSPFLRWVDPDRTGRWASFRSGRT